MKIYLAARYVRAAEMRDARRVLESLGHEVISSWIDMPVASTPDARAYLAAMAVEEIRACDTLISFTGEGGLGGRHAEFGIALALGRRLVVTGPREHVFHDLPEVEWHPDWVHLVTAWSFELSGVPA